MPKLSRSEETPWARKMNAARTAKVVVLDRTFAGIPAGSKLLIATPKILADYLARIPYGEQRNIVRLRNELARRHRAHATCPVTTAIFLRIVAESALEDLAMGRPLEAVTPFWRAIEPDSRIATKLSCDSAWLRELRTAEGIVDTPAKTKPTTAKKSATHRAAPMPRRRRTPASEKT
jgi:hypothetical protein